MSTPMLNQFKEIKDQYKDALLLYRMGDFYELFFDDAVTAASILNITLTSRNKVDDKPVPMCGFPFHALRNYMPRLVRAGYKVALCEQIGDPKKTKGVVKRDVVQIVTPGLISLIEQGREEENNFLMFLSKFDDRFAVAYIDIATGVFRCTDGSADEIRNEAERVMPNEILITLSQSDTIKTSVLKDMPFVFIQEVDDAFIEHEITHNILLTQFQCLTLSGYGLKDKSPSVCSAGGLLKYILDTQKRDLSHITSLEYYVISDYMVLDEATIKNLELFSSIQTNEKKGSLLDILDHTVTAAGARLIRQWMKYPLIDLEKILWRQNAVTELKEDQPLLEDLRNFLKKINDLERLNGRIAMSSATPRDLNALAESIISLPGLETLIKKGMAQAFKELSTDFDLLGDIGDSIMAAIVDDPPPHTRDGGFIRQGYDSELDKVIGASRASKDWIARLEEKERQKTGINTLKVGYNRVFGYYLEVSKGQVSKVPDDYIRKQTLVNAERYITPLLKEQEILVLGADEKKKELELQLYHDLLKKLVLAGDRIKDVAARLAILDVFASLAYVSAAFDYHCPVMSLEDGINLKECRHPVIERTLEKESFVPNDIFLNNSERVLLITGPNMAGKSTVLRQTAIAVLMAQVGSHVAASVCEMGIVDRIFTRVGAMDDISRGRSTFMVEMIETASILNNATTDSLVIIDEVGRGTSTFDGLSIAWAVAEALHNFNETGIKTLFATHYHELTDLAESKPMVKNYHVAVKEYMDKILFLRELVPGPMRRSYGIEVARLAGLPSKVVERAKEVLCQLEQNDIKCHILCDDMDGKGISSQLSIFSTPEDRIISMLKGMNPNKLKQAQSMRILKDFCLSLKG